MGHTMDSNDMTGAVYCISHIDTDACGMLQSLSHRTRNRGAGSQHHAYGRGRRTEQRSYKGSWGSASHGQRAAALLDGVSEHQQGFGPRFPLASLPAGYPECIAPDEENS